MDEAQKARFTSVAPTTITWSRYAAEESTVIRAAFHSAGIPSFPAENTTSGRWPCAASVDIASTKSLYQTCRCARLMLSVCGLVSLAGL